MSDRSIVRASALSVRASRPTIEGYPAWAPLLPARRERDRSLSHRRPKIVAGDSGQHSTASNFPGELEQSDFELGPEAGN
jgi:hypothetical protein